MFRLVGLVLWMFAGALFGGTFISSYLLDANFGYDHGFGESAKCNLVGTIIGALSGVMIEAFCRHRVYPDKSLPMRVSMRTLLLVMTAVAIVLGIIGWSVR